MSETHLRLNPTCVTCLLQKYLRMVPDEADDWHRLTYMQRVMGILAATPPTCSAPEVVEQFTVLREELFGIKEDLSAEKAYFNALILAQEPLLRERIRRSADPLTLALRYAMLGNYIDFAAMDKVDEQYLNTLLEGADTLPFDDRELATLRTELGSARRLVYLTDNCGEIGLDKLFIEELLRTFPALQAEAIVRGAPVHNDATLEDARQVGLDRLIPVSHNGTGIAGTCLSRISLQAREKVDAADVIIAKGQGNFETLRHCGKNVYYLFMCKCEMFAQRFQVPLYNGMLVNDRRM
ncbi:MAG: DUF89 family protein [Clostridia bacterium]|nr:DUF89 family protein [Clostridia bacterium]